MNPENLFRLDGKVALVTGGYGGIGDAVCRGLAAVGAKVAVTGHNADKACACADALTQQGADAFATAFDSVSVAETRRMVDEVAGHFGRLDILVNCAARVAGTVPEPKLADITDDSFFPDMNVKVLGYLRCAREAAPYMRQNGWGRIINLSGLAARRGGSILAATRNAAVVAASKSLADELGPHGINVAVVHPGTTFTERIPGMIAGLAEREGISHEEAERRIGSGSLVGRIIDAREVAYVVAFLASPKSVAITGELIGVSGGMPGAIFY